MTQSSAFYDFPLFSFISLKFVREGDEFSFSRVDRVAHSALDLQWIVKELAGKGVTLTAREKPISTKDATSKCFLDMLGVFAELETNLRKRDRQRTSLGAKEKGVYKNRRSSIDADQIK